MNLHVCKLQLPEIGKLYTLADGPYGIGHEEANSIVLKGSDISDRHALLRVKGKQAAVFRYPDSLEVYVGGSLLKPNASRKVPLLIPISCGLYDLYLYEDGQELELDIEINKKKAQVFSNGEGIDVFMREVQTELFERLDIVRLEAQHIDRDELRRRASAIVVEISNERAGDIPSGRTPAQIIKAVLDEALGLGPLEDLLEDDSVDEIMVVRRDQIYVEREGKIVPSDARFSSDEHLRHAIERIVSSKARRVDEMQPYVDTRLSDGSRVNAIIPPIAIDSPVLTIRKFPANRLTVEDLISLRSCTREMLRFIQLCVKHHRSILVSGGTGSGKTTLLNILSSFIPGDERLITIEDSAELNLPQKHVIRLESRPASIEGQGRISIRDLVRNSLRMRPDRIIVGECRGGEAIDMLQAMNTGHEGSMTTLHANSTRDALRRLSTMCLMSGLTLPTHSILEQIASAIHLVIQTERMVDGKRRIVEIAELKGMVGEEVCCEPIYRFQERRYLPSGEIVGDFLCMKPKPQIFEDLESRRIEIFELGTDIEDPLDAMQG